MKRTRLSCILLSVLLFFSFHISIFSQGLYEVGFGEKVQNSSLIVEGKVLSKESFWNSAHTMIFTSNKVEIYKIFKGAANNDYIEILTQGGQVDNVSVSTSDLASLIPGDVGTFFCFPNLLNIKSPTTNNVLYDIYGSSQGFIKYNPITLTANAPFVRLNDVEKNLYSALEEKTGEPLRAVKSFDVSSLRSTHPGYRTLAVSITSFSPTTVNAGATLDPSTNVLTITGTNFGTASGSAAVFFDDADDGIGGSFMAVPYSDPLMISWTSTSIKLRVPGNAGTGSIIVRDNLGNTATSATNLTVNYAILTATFSFAGTTITKETNLMNTDGAGGYTIHYSTSTAGGGVDLNAAAGSKQAFQRAMTTWKELVGFNITEGSTTTNQVIADDGVNTIMFDNTNTGQAPLASGVLGVCYYFASMCTPLATREPQRTGFDIVIRNAGVSLGSASFTTGPCPPASSSFLNLDLETVLLHELGHAIGLGHINDSYQGSFLPTLNPGKLMNYALVNGVKRNSPDQSAYNGALYLTTPQGNAYGACGLYTSEMTQLARITESKDECPVFPTTPLPNASVVSFDLEHATSNKFSDPQYTAMNCSGTGTGITNTAFYALKTKNAGALILSVSGYATNPAAQSSCTPSAGYPAAAGVELAVYAVSSCPAGQSFPAPIACRTFNGNGVMGSIAGLLGNTTYLIVLDGIENTKATFNLTFGGTVLPITIQNFTGEILPDFNQLKWSVQDYDRIKSLSVERSGDGTNFVQIKRFDDAGGAVHYYNDNLPLIGKNYYRLAIESVNGTEQYSNIVLLERQENVLIAAYPNPVRSVIHIQMQVRETGTYVFDLYNNVGQLIIHHSEAISQNNQTVSLPIKNFSSGSYFLRVSNDHNQLIKNISLVKN